MRDRSERRYAAVPWLEDADLRPMGDPETTVELAGGAEIAHGLVIAQPFGPGSDAILTVHAVMETGVITLAVTNAIELDVTPAVVDVPLQSNPRRVVDRE